MPFGNKLLPNTVWHDAENILAEMNKTSLRFEVQTPVQKPGQINPQLLAALAGLASRKAMMNAQKEQKNESAD